MATAFGLRLAAQGLLGTLAAARRFRVPIVLGASAAVIYSVYALR